MDALEYLKAHGEVHCDAMARRAGTSLGYFKQIAYRHRRPGADLAKALERETQGALSAADLVFVELKRPNESDASSEAA